MRRYRQLTIILVFIFSILLTLPVSAASEDSGDQLIVGVPVDRCPVFYKDDHGEIVGIGVDLMRYAAKEAGYSVTFKLIEEPTLKDALDSEKYDLLMPFGSAITSTGGQSSIVSENLTQTPFTLVTLDDKELPDLNNLKVGMLTSLGGGAETVKQLYPGIEIIFYDTMPESFKALRARKVDALMHNSYVWSYILEKPAYNNLTLQPSSMFSMDFRAGTLDTIKGHEIIERLNFGIAKIPETARQAIVLDYTTRKLYKYDLFDYIYQYGLIVAVFASIVLIISIENTKLKRAEKIADEASKAKSLFLANMSHEIRTPINTIMGMGEMISRETTDNRLLQYAYSINRSANSLLGLVNDILDFSRMEAGKLKLRDEPYHLSNLLTDVNMMIKGRASSKELNYKVIVNKAIPDELIGDETRLKQVIINLLTNAVKYTVKGFVHLTLDFEKADKESVFLKITIEDSGIGMKKSELGRLYNAFERLDEDRNKTIEGAGLGMSIVKQILDAMDSTLSVHSVYGKGSTFSFVVKQKVACWDQIGDYNETARMVVYKKQHYHPSFTAPDAKILIVDDTEINNTVITGLLAPTKMHIDTALSGKQALKLLESTKYDILLLDYRMPEMDGLELLNRIKSDLDNLNYYSVCIVLTANAIEGARDLYMRAGFDEYLEKPVNGLQLESMLLRFLPEDKIIRSRYKTPDLEKDVTGQDDANGNAAVNDVKNAAISKPAETFVDNVVDISKGKADDTLPDNNNFSGNTAASVSDSSKPVLASKELQRLQDAGYINAYDGISYGGSEEVFIDALRLFRSSIDKKSDEIEGLYFSENIEDFTVKVHALKSSARLIGAYDLSDKARMLEEAGKNNDMDYIREHTHEVLEEYSKYKKILGKV